jgi:hypothetical protein
MAALVWRRALTSWPWVACGPAQADPQPMGQLPEGVAVQELLLAGSDHSAMTWVVQRSSWLSCSSRAGRVPRATRRPAGTRPASHRKAGENAAGKFLPPSWRKSARAALLFSHTATVAGRSAAARRAAKPAVRGGCRQSGCPAAHVVAARCVQRARTGPVWIRPVRPQKEQVRQSPGPGRVQAAQRGSLLVRPRTCVAFPYREQRAQRCCRLRTTAHRWSLDGEHPAFRPQT